MQSGSFEVVTIPRLLLVADDVVFVRLVVKVLARDYEVVAASSAHDALDRIARNEPFDAILVDMQLRGMTGQDFMQRLDALRPDLACSVAFVTGGAPDDETTLRSVPNSRLRKPFGVTELRDFVAALLASEPVVETRRGAGP
jgi:CheY-like chemotaxis protein